MSAESLSGTIIRVTYFSEENGYSVLRMEAEGTLPEKAIDRDGLVTVTGNLPELAAGEHLQLSGDWTFHPKYGMQFQVQHIKQARPATLDGIRRYLGSGLLKGIGPAIAESIVDKFGTDTIDVIENQPQRLREVPDIGPKRSKQILKAWQEQKQIREVMIFLHEFGISSNLATKIIKQYGDNAIQIVETDPYQLARDIYGVGFKTADGIAQSMGLPKDHPTRLEAGLVHLLNEFVGEGHVFAPKQDLIEEARVLLSVNNTHLEDALDRLEKGEQIVAERNTQGQTAIYPIALHVSEIGLATRLVELSQTSISRLGEMPAFELLALESELSEEQLKAVKIALLQPLSILTGGPGTGKTTTIKALIAALEAGGKRYALASPTGRAAKRLSEASDKPASTIHRLLGFSPTEGWKHNEESPLPLDLLVVDEASMLDLNLAYALVRALEEGTHLLLVGDVDQLPSVGAGDVLREIISSAMAPITRLNVIFRQAADSHIISNAHRINHGEMPDFPKESEDFFLFPAKDGEEAANWLGDLLTERIPQRFALDPLHDVQVMAPLYRGAAGVNALNIQLQDALNPPSALKAERAFFGQNLRVGDKMMQVKNDYDKGVFNGDIGELKEISSENQTLTMSFEGHSVTYEWSEGDQLTLAYAITVHKAQGSEFPAVVMPILTQHYIMLQRNLLYTAVTRAKKLCVLVGNRKAIAIALNNNQVAERWSGLAERLISAISTLE